MGIAYLIALIVAFYLFANSLYVLIFAIASRLPQKSKSKHITPKTTFLKFALIVPAFKNDHVILETLPRNLRINYPRDKFRIIVAGDALQNETIEKLSLYDADILDLHLIKSSKVKAIHNTDFLIQQGKFDYIILLDIDNELETDYLLKLNNFIQPEMQIIQTHRGAKNLDTPFSVLDAMSEEVNNSIFRKGHDRLGLSAALIGSGVVIRSDYFIQNMMGWKAVGGFDKELELEIASKNIRVRYAEDINVYDEKTRYIGELKMQRRRWISAQVFYFRTNIIRSLKRLIRNGNLNYLNKLIQLTLVPRIMLLGLFFLVFIFQWIFFPQYMMITFVGFLMNVAAIIIALPLKFWNIQYYRSIMYVPFAFIVIVLSMAKLKGANRKFISTPHHSKRDGH